MRSVDGYDLASALAGPDTPLEYRPCMSRCVSNRKARALMARSANVFADTAIFARRHAVVPAGPRMGRG